MQPAFIYPIALQLFLIGSNVGYYEEATDRLEDPLLLSALSLCLERWV